MLKAKIALLCLMVSGALYTGSQALGRLNSVRQSGLPEKIYASYEAQTSFAEYYLKSREGYVAIFGDSRYKEPLRLTEIESKSLRRADRAMLEKGIPVRDRVQLLQLLEDLGS